METSRENKEVDNVSKQEKEPIGVWKRKQEKENKKKEYACANCSSFSKQMKPMVHW